jgi:hypothetical protein
VVDRSRSQLNDPDFTSVSRVVLTVRRVPTDNIRTSGQKVLTFQRSRFARVRLKNASAFFITKAERLSADTKSLSERGDSNRKALVQYPPIS